MTPLRLRAVGHEPAGFLLTNKTVEKCCCVHQKDGKLYCTLAKKTVDPCCCKPAEK